MSDEYVPPHWKVWNPDKGEWERTTGQTWDELKDAWDKLLVKHDLGTAYQWDGHTWQLVADPAKRYRQLLFFDGD